MALTIDGGEEPPEVIKELDGQPLHYVVDRDALSGRMLNVFTEKERAEGHFRETVDEALPRQRRGGSAEVEAHQSAYPGGVPPNGGYVDLYEDDWWGGCSWRFYESQRVLRDFRTIGACGFLWWGWVNPNDRVSCIDALVSGARPACILCEHVLLGGSWLWLPGRCFVPSLIPWGWNDRASSLMIMQFS